MGLNLAGGRDRVERCPILNDSTGRYHSPDARLLRHLPPPGWNSSPPPNWCAVGAAVGAIEPGGVSFEAAPGIVYAANLRLRTASRIIVRVAQFHAASFAELEQHARRVPWHRWVRPGGAVHFRVTSHKSRLYHQDAVAERLERAVLPGHSRRAPGAGAVGRRRASTTTSTALPGVQRFLVRLVDDQLVLSVDSSGSLLHRRGYRQASGKAPLRETLAAALLLALEWDGSTPLVDPLCGLGDHPHRGRLAGPPDSAGLAPALRL